MPDRPRAKPATIEDVAAASGVSVATVSRALRGLPNVAPSTRERVREIATQLRYQPDPAAARLASGRSRTVVMAVPVLSSWYFSQVMAGAEAVFSEAGHDLLVFAVDSEQNRSGFLGRAEVRRASGMILADLRVAPEEVLELGAAGVEVVTIGTEVAGCSTVFIDDEDVGRMAAEHLVGLGHRAIGLLSGQAEDPMNFAVPQRRRAGYQQALAAHGITVRPELEQAGNFSIRGGAEAMRELLALPDPPTAVFAMADEMAFGAIRAVWDSGRRVPRDVSIVGVDDHDLSPVLSLTTVRQNVSEHGAMAARLLLEQLADPSRGPARIERPVELVVRATTAPPGREPATPPPGSPGPP